MTCPACNAPEALVPHTTVRHVHEPGYHEPRPRQEWDGKTYHCVMCRAVVALRIV